MAQRVKLQVTTTSVPVLSTNSHLCFALSTGHRALCAKIDPNKPKVYIYIKYIYIMGIYVQLYRYICIVIMCSEIGVILYSHIRSLLPRLSTIIVQRNSAISMPCNCGC